MIEEDKKDLKVTLYIIGFTLLFFIFILFTLNLFDKYETRVSCESFGRESNRPTKYVEYNYWHCDCLTLSKDEKWISVYNLRGE